MKWVFARQVVAFAVGFWIFTLALGALVFLLSHIPPRAINMDTAILALGKVERFLAWPRTLMRLCWPGESAPIVFNYAASVLNCLIWGLFLAGAKRAWNKIRE